MRGIYYGDSFEWDDNNEAHLSRHGVDRYEAEEAATDEGAILRRRRQDRFGNPRYLCIGKTIDGRYLFLIVDKKGIQRWRIGTARDATFEEKRAYRKRNR
jgi:uncharacterized DUF497 family protein